MKAEKRIKVVVDLGGGEDDDENQNCSGSQVESR